MGIKVKRIDLKREYIYILKKLILNNVFCFNKVNCFVRKKSRIEIMYKASDKHKFVFEKRNLFLRKESCFALK